MANLIQNVVSTAHLSHNIDLNFIASNDTKINYNPKRFTGAIFRIPNPRITSLIFSNGKIVTTGGKSITENKEGAQIIAESIQKIYEESNKEVKIILCNYTVQNIVGSFTVPYKIDLIALNMAQKKNSRYDASIFPGLKITPFTSSKSTAVIFISGKIILTGFKETSKLQEMKEYISRLLLRYKRPFPYTTMEF